MSKWLELEAPLIYQQINGEFVRLEKVPLRFGRPRKVDFAFLLPKNYKLPKGADYGLRVVAYPVKVENAQRFSPVAERRN